MEIPKDPARLLQVDHEILSTVLAGGKFHRASGAMFLRAPSTDFLLRSTSHSCSSFSPNLISARSKNFQCFVQSEVELEPPFNRFSISPAKPLLCILTIGKQCF